jgi:hypothetical protein
MATPTAAPTEDQQEARQDSSDKACPATRGLEAEGDVVPIEPLLKRIGPRARKPDIVLQAVLRPSLPVATASDPLIVTLCT